MKNTTSKHLLMMGIAYSLLTIAAQGESVLLNFGSAVSGADPLESPGHVLGGITGTNWNVIGISGASSGLLNADGSDHASLQVDIARGNGSGTLIDWAGANNASGATTGGSFGATGIFSNNAASFLFGWQELGARVMGLDAGLYRIFVTARHTKNGASAVGDYTVHGGVVDSLSGTTTYTGFDAQLLSNDTDASWVLDDNFWYFEVTLDGTDDIVIAVDGKGAESQNVMNTVEIQKVSNAGSVILFR